MSTSVGLIQYSTVESEVLGLKIGRCNTDSLNADALCAEIIAGNYDVCRLKIPAEEEEASLKLHMTGLPFFFSGSIRRYKTRIESYPPGDFIHPEMIFEEYDGSQLQLLRDMIEGTWGDYPIGYYRTPYLNHLVSKEAEVESLFSFYSKQNLKTINPGNTFMFMKEGDHYVGFFALNVIDGNLESHIGGILKPYRKGGYFLDMLRFIKRYCVDHNLPHFLFGARNENAYVQKIFQQVGFKAIGSENVFHIVPLFSRCDESFSLDVYPDDVSYFSILRMIAEQLEPMHLSMGNKFDFRLLESPLTRARHRLTVSLLDMSPCLGIILVENDEQAVIGFGHFNTFRVT